MKDAKDIAKSYRKRYVLALMLIALLALMAHFVVRHTITTHGNAGTLINLSGQQRMLSQKIALHVSQLSASAEKDDSFEISRKLQAAISLFENNHLYITESNKHYLSERQTQLYFDGQSSLDYRVNAYIKTASSILRGQAVSAEQKLMFAPTYTDALLNDLDAVVKDFESQLTADMKELVSIELYIFIATMILLLLELVFIFRPLEVSYINSIKSLIKEKQALFEAKQQLEHLNSVKSRFMASMSHELRTPLAGIFGMLELAKLENEPTKRRVYLAKAKDAGKNLLGLINEVLDVSRLDADLVNVENSDFNLHQLLDTCCAPVAIECEKKGLEFQYHSVGEIPEWINSDANKLIQIINVLLGNAVKFTERGSIEMTSQLLVKEKQVWLYFKIVDTGIGISEKDIELIKQPFTQVDSASTRRFGGIGLGLNICQQLVTLLDGQLSMESQKGRGSSFSVEIPVSVSSRPEQLPPKQGAGSIAKFAIVDDLATSREYLSSLLSAQGFQVDLFSSSSELIGNANHILDYTAIILDLHMPGLDGKELASVLKAAHGDRCPPLVIVSASVENIDKQDMASYGIELIFEKPIDQRRFVDSMNSLSQLRGHLVAEKPTLKILVVEDEDINAEILKHILTNFGYESFRAKNGVEAIECAKSRKFDLILMDINMPLMDGHEASKTIVYDLKIPIPIIAVTANAYELDKEQSIQAGMKYHLVKPVSSDDLLSTIELIRINENI